MINCWPGNIGTGPKPAVLSSVSILSWVALNRTDFGWPEKLVSVSSVLNWLISTTAGRVCTRAPSSEAALTGKTKEPSELALSLMTP